MYDFNVGNIVARKSYGGDIAFKVGDIIEGRGKEPIYILKGLMYRIKADARADDLMKPEPSKVYSEISQHTYQVKKLANRDRGPFDLFLSRLRGKPGKVLHIDADEEFLGKCVSYYKQHGLSVVGKKIAEKEQPERVRQLLRQYQPDILVMTGHDGVKKGASNMNSLDSYWNSRYFVQSVGAAREYEPSSDKLCVFAGACQSYYEAIMSAGANFASSPERILINCYDPALVADKIAYTDNHKVVSPREVADITVTGSKGVWGVSSRGQLK